MFDQCIVPLLYQHPVADMIQRVKHARNLTYLMPLIRPLLDGVETCYESQPWPEAIIPVPLHWWKLRLRGFNQAGLIARKAAKATGLPLADRLLIRTRHTPSQQALSASKRASNMRGAFRTTKPLPYKHVALVDDVMTTGATAEEACRALKQAGATRVDIWCLARTPAER